MQHITLQLRKHHINTENVKTFSLGYLQMWDIPVHNYLPRVDLFEMLKGVGET